MIDVTARIKNLSIALEAISHVNGTRSEYDRLRAALQEELDQLEKEQKAHLARPAKPELHNVL